MDGTENQGIKLPPVIGPDRGPVRSTIYPKTERSISEAATIAASGAKVPNADQIILPNPNQG